MLKTTHSITRRPFFYYKYSNDFHFWYLYDLATGKTLKNKTKILDYIVCPSEEKRVIPEFFEKVYEVNMEIIKDIEATYREVEQQENVDPKISEISGDKSKKFIYTIIREMDLRLNDYLLDLPEGAEIEERWEKTRERLIAINLTKKRLQILRAIWRSYTYEHKDWKKLLNNISEFLEGKIAIEKEKILPYNPKLLKLITIDFIS